MKTDAIKAAWPPRALSPNARVHWAKTHKARSAQKNEGWMLARLHGLHKRDWPDEIAVTLEFCPPSRHRRDLDNFMASCKALLDGLALGMGVDDSRFRPVATWGDRVKGGAVRVWI